VKFLPPTDADGFGVSAGASSKCRDPTGIPEDRCRHTSYALRDGTAISTAQLPCIFRSECVSLASLHMSPARQWFLDRLTSSVGSSGESSFSGTCALAQCGSGSRQGERPGFLNSQPGRSPIEIDGIGPVQKGRHLATHEQNNTHFPRSDAQPGPGHLLQWPAGWIQQQSVLLVHGSGRCSSGSNAGMVFQVLLRTSAKRW